MSTGRPITIIESKFQTDALGMGDARLPVRLDRGEDLIIRRVRVMGASRSSIADTATGAAVAIDGTVTAAAVTRDAAETMVFMRNFLRDVSAGARSCMRRRHRRGCRCAEWPVD